MEDSQLFYFLVWRWTMSAGFNSTLPYQTLNVKDLQDAFGSPQFSGAAGESVTLVWNGLIIQISSIAATVGTTTIPFNVAFTQQVLGVWVQPSLAAASVGVPTVTLEDFDLQLSGSDATCY